MENMIEIVRYKTQQKKEWDGFVNKSKNGLFLFCREYMDYHADRFIDHSLMFYAKGKLVAVLPASEKKSELVSHGGLTFGGILTDRSMKMITMCDIFNHLIIYLRERQFRRLIYKAIPHIYHSIPAEEDLYALFKHNAKLIRRDVSSTINFQVKTSYSKGRKWSINKAKKRGVQIIKSDDFETFMEIEKYVLQKYHNVNPVHTATEIKMLAEHFPDNIKLFSAVEKDKMLAGVIIYESPEVAHAQYIASTDEGKQDGAADLILDYLISEYYTDKKYFDFGISTENNGRYLNKGLISNKEGFGARSTVFDFYELLIQG